MLFAPCDVLEGLQYEFKNGRAEPHPGSRLPLVIFRQVDGSPVSGHACEVISTPFGVGEAERVDIVPHATGKIRDIQNGIGVLEPRSHRLRFRLMDVHLSHLPWQHQANQLAREPPRRTH